MRAPVRRRNRVTAALVAGLACLSMALAGGVLVGGVLTAAAPASAASSPSTFTVALSGSVSTFNPFLSYHASELVVIGEIYPTLVGTDNDFKPTPYLATSWSSSPDKLTWTFKLRTGLTWSDGKPITADDVAWTMNTIMTDKVAGTSNGSLLANFAHVTAPDDATVVITTNSPQANMLAINAPITGIPIVPRHIWQPKIADLANEKNTTTPVVGYGPYQLTGYTTDQFATLTATRDFVLGTPKNQRLIYRYFKNVDAAVAALRSGSVDEVGSLTATQYAGLKGQSGIATYQSPGTRWTGVEVNAGARTVSGKKIGAGNPALADPVVRTAIATAIDRKTLVEKVLNGLGTVGAGYLPPGYPQFFWHPDAATAIGYDPAAAKAMLDKAGYRAGANGIRVDAKTGKPLTLRLGIHSDSTTDAQIANYLSGWLKQVGIGLSVQSQSGTALNANLAKGDWDLLMDSWGTGPDPSYLLSIQTCAVLPQDDGTAGNTDSFFCDPAYDKLYAQQQTQFDQGARAQTIAAMQKILYQANQDIVLFYANDLSAVRTSSVSGYMQGTPDSQGFMPLQNTFLAVQRATPVAATAAAGGTSPVVWIVVGVVVVLLAGGAVLLIRRRSSAAERE